MKKIYKYSLNIADRQVISMPKGAEILKCAIQDKQLCIWVCVTPDNEPEDVIIRIYGTGHNIASKTIQYIDSVFQDVYVWHVFREYDNPANWEGNNK